MKILLNIMLLIAVLLPAGCTHNNGDIGGLFGQWQLVSMESEGKDSPEYQGNIFWSFQNSTIEMKEMAAHHEMYRTFGNYSVDDGKLCLSFPDRDFPPNPKTGLPRECVLQIIRHTGGELILSYGEPATIYRFRKW